MKDSREQQIQAILQALLNVRAQMLAILDEHISILQVQLTECSRSAQPTQRLSVDRGDVTIPVVDRRVMCVVFRGKQCFLGNTLMLRLVERLTDSPNEYVSYRTLLTEVWHGQRDPSSIRSVVKELRIRLNAAEMFELAGAIKGHSGHYGLMLGSFN